MTDKLERYQAVGSTPEGNRLWPLYGAGFENLGRDGKPIGVDIPAYGPDELLVRHDACGICFSDVKVINAGNEHPRIYRDMKLEPVVLGHEVSLTVVGVGENLANQYNVGDRFIVQADIHVNGISYAYGYELQGGMSQYAVIDQRVFNGDDGNYLIPVQADTGYAESALAEPWACVIATYQLNYRTGLKSGGSTWIIGTPGADKEYYFSAGFDEENHPARLALTRVPEPLATWLRETAARLQIEVIDIPLETLHDPNSELPAFDDIIVLGPVPDLIEAASPRLADFGILAIMATESLSRPVQVDVGRIHYNRWTYVGGSGPDIARAYSDHPIQAELKAGGKAWFIGAGGPMGQMHAQRAILLPDHPTQILCTARTPDRLKKLSENFRPEAQAKGIDFSCLSLSETGYADRLLEISGAGFDDIIVMAPSTSAVADAAAFLAPGGVMNIFAGLKRGTMVPLDLSLVYQKNIRFIGHSGSKIDDLRVMLHQTESGQLSPNRSVEAIGSLEAARDGLQAVRDARFPGKVVVFPQINDLPLTPLSELKHKLPTVYALLKDGREWTTAAEQEFLERMLP
jgi:threonine dehydrogenase-like Zn-dependent dehydrogenase